MILRFPTVLLTPILTCLYLIMSNDKYDAEQFWCLITFGIPHETLIHLSSSLRDNWRLLCRPIFCSRTPKGYVSKNISRTQYCIFVRSMNTYGKNKGCFLKIPDKCGFTNICNVIASLHVANNIWEAIKVWKKSM